MIIGVPREIKENEYRVAITPAGVSKLVGRGHEVIIESTAGEGSGFTDRLFEKAGAMIVKDAGAVFGAAGMIMKVKEPLDSEFGKLQKGQLLFTFLHLAPDPLQTRALLERKVTGIAYETIELADGSLPVLTPMSEIAGRMATQIGARLLESASGGRGVLLGGVPGVAPASVVIIGAGTVGRNAAKIAVGMGARVTILDIDLSRLRHLDELYGNRLVTLFSNEYNIAGAVSEADLLIGAILSPGAKALRVVTEEMVSSMKKGSVIVDVAIDQGGCVETICKTTTHSEPTYTRHGVIHYSVPNIPGAVARTSTLALTNVTLPYALEIAGKGWLKAVCDNPALARGVNVHDGKITYRAVAEAMEMEHHDLFSLL